VSAIQVRLVPLIVFHLSLPFRGTCIKRLTPIELIFSNWVCKSLPKLYFGAHFLVFVASQDFLSGSPPGQPKHTPADRGRPRGALMLFFTLPYVEEPVLYLDSKVSFFPLARGTDTVRIFFGSLPPNHTFRLCLRNAVLDSCYCQTLQGTQGDGF